MAFRLRAWGGFVSLTVCLTILSPLASAQTVWSGLTFNFTKAANGDASLPENQDRITNDVWITRNSFGMGLLNASSECDALLGCTYTHNSSPADTEWANAAMPANSDQTIAATNWQNLAFTNWEGSYGNIVGRVILTPTYRDAVVHLISDDIYLDLRFTDWGQLGAGGFSYLRSTPSSTPTSTGDYNHNGVVDAADYVMWRNTLGQSASPAGSGADGNGNGTIDEGDYSFWRSKFGNVAPGSGAGGSLTGAEVPEPMVTTLLTVGLVFGLLRLRHRRGFRCEFELNRA
jgi:hypothetical protein